MVATVLQLVYIQRINTNAVVVVMMVYRRPKTVLVKTLARETTVWGND